jgi:uncharacterized protein (TIGR02391 family)
MNDIMTLSKLLREADSILRKAERLARSHSRKTDLAGFTELEQRYTRWYQDCLESLPDDLGAQFAHLYQPGTANIPMISDFFRETNASVQAKLGDESTSSPPTLSWWRYHEAFKYPLSQQRELLFFARRRLWIDTSILPKDMRVGIATTCKRAYQLFTIDDLFTRSGCEPHWYVPPFIPDPKFERTNRALGWLDGILVYAPSQELAISQTVCETMLAKPSISDEEREKIRGWLAQLQQPAPTLDNPLDRYDLHPTVRYVAGPLVAGNHLNQALLSVCIALNNAVQEKAQSTLDGSALMQRVFSQNNPILRCAHDSTEQQGWMFLFTGAMMAIRNPRAHRLMDDLTEVEAIEWLMFLSALFRALDAAENITTP